ncbi:MAG: hypothetical protein WC675_05270 [Patescibacteria group bacterium]|jgi:hypothetical protein
MYRVSTNISKEKFEKMISGNKGYIPSETLRALQENKKGDLLYKKSVKKEEALEVIQYLAKKGLIPMTRSPYKLVQAALEEQQKEEQKKQDEEKTKLKKQKQAEEEKAKEEAMTKSMSPARAKAYIAMERGEELLAEDRGESKIQYDQRSPSNRLLDELDREKETRDTKAAKEKEGVEKYYSKKDSRRRKPDLVDMSKLHDMDIG